jgi:hypothetical protein
MGRVLGVAAIFAGALVGGFNPNRFDTVLFDLPRGHGVHLHDVIGMAFVVAGTAMLWFSPRRG